MHTANTQRHTVGKVKKNSYAEWSVYAMNGYEIMIKIIGFFFSFVVEYYAMRIVAHFSHKLQ